MSKENLILSIKRYRGRIYANLVDNKGNIFSTSEEKISGIARTNMSEQQENKKQYYTLFTPGGNYTVVMAFKSEQESQGTIYSFSMDCFRYIGGKENKGQYEQFSVGISNMRIQQESKPKGR